MTPIAVTVIQLSKKFRVHGRASARERKGADPRLRRNGRRITFQALSDIGFELAAGQTLGLVGANGSGKSTLLKILAGVMHADEGEVKIQGRVGALLELGAGFHPDLTGLENIQLNAAVLGLGRNQMQKALPEIIEFAELERFMDVPVKHYSSGMVVRLGFAIAAQLNPDVLLLDETFAVGDAKFQKRALDKIRQLKTQGVTMILVSHSGDMIEDLADRAIWIDRGRIRAEGDPGVVVAEYETMASQQAGTFFGAPTANASADGKDTNANANALGRVQILSAEIGGTPAPEPEDRKALTYIGQEEGPLELLSESELRIDAELEVGPHCDWEKHRIAVLFKRNDGRVVAQSQTALADLVESGSQGESLPAPSGKVRTTIAIDPIRLAQGEYEISLAVKHVPEPDSFRLGERFSIPQKLRIVSPLPLEGFRMIAQTPARWEN